MTYNGDNRVSGLNVREKSMNYAIQALQSGVGDNIGEILGNAAQIETYLRGPVQAGRQSDGGTVRPTALPETPHEAGEAVKFEEDRRGFETHGPGCPKINDLGHGKWCFTARD